MEATLEQRVASLEQEMIELRGASAARQMPWLRPVKKDWQSTFGTAKNDVGYDEMIRLGEEYRRSMTYEKELEAPDASA